MMTRVESPQVFVEPLLAGVKRAALPSDRRNLAVDTLRLIGVFAVVCLHTRPFDAVRMAGYAPQWQMLNFGISSAARFAVPFFFCISGYFWGKKLRKGVDVGAVTGAMFRRVGAAFVFWLFFYLLLNGLIQGVLRHFFPGFSNGSTAIPRSAFWNPLALLHTHFTLHLWFLPSLLCVLLVGWFFIRFNLARYYLATTIVLYLVAVLARAYVATPIGIPIEIFGYPLDTRDGPFWGAIYFATGYLLSARVPQRRWAWWGSALLVAGLCAHMVEVHLIGVLFHLPALPMNQQDFVFSSYAMGPGATLLALAQPAWLSSVTMARWGRLTLGIYCVHLFFVIVLSGAVARLHAPWAEVLYPVTVFFLSVLATVLLARIQWMRAFVQ